MNTLSHVAIIMDGNGRWAKKKNKSRKFGHFKGTQNIKPIVDHCLKKKIKYLTLFAFALDNWRRPKAEINYLFILFQNFFEENIDSLLKKNIRIRFIGEISKLPIKIKKIIKKIEQLSKKNKDLFLTIALNYSSKHEILNSFKKIIKKKLKKINIKDINDNLYTTYLPDPEILIRTGGTNRLSNFLLWQISYSEIFFLKKFWPDFKVTDMSSIISRYKKIKRNFGSI